MAIHNRFSTNLVNVKKMTRLALLTAVVVVLQLIGGSITVGQLAINLTLIPVVIGAVLYGPLAGAWLGLACAVVILLSPSQVAFFYELNVPGTILIVLLKGMLSGYLSGVAASLLQKKNGVLAVFIAAAVCPIVNTGIFLLGARVFFSDWVRSSASINGKNVATYLLIGLAGVNFLVELLTNLVLSPVVIRLLPFLGAKIVNKQKQAESADSAENDRQDG